MSDKWTEHFISSPCVATNHEECRHVHGSIQCQCACHSHCPARSTSGDQDPTEICTCPGRTSRQEDLNERGNMRKDGPTARPPSVLGVMKIARGSYRSTRARGDARKKAEELVASTARGKTREETRARLLAEYARHGIPPRPEPLFDNIVRLMITDDPSERAALLTQQRQMELELAQVISGKIGRLKQLFSELEEDGDEEVEEDGL